MGYSFVGVLVTGVVLSIAELRSELPLSAKCILLTPSSALLPLSGAIIRHAEHFVDPALSFAQGWNVVYSSMVSLPAELTAAAVIVQFWSSINSAIWITVFGILLIGSNLLFVRVYGEMEFTFATLKIMLIVGLNIMVRHDSEYGPGIRSNILTGSCYCLRWRPRSPRIRVPVLAQSWTIC